MIFLSYSSETDSSVVVFDNLALEHRVHDVYAKDASQNACRELLAIFYDGTKS